MTLVEIMVAMVILTIVALGALGYQYHAAEHAQIAKVEIIATRTAQLLLEDWKSGGGSEDYDPATLDLGFTSTSFAPPDFSQGVGTGMPLNNRVYVIIVDDFPMLVLLTWEDVAHDPVAEVTLRQLSVTAKWGQRVGKSQDAKVVTQQQAERIFQGPSLILTTYVRLDASDG